MNQGDLFNQMPASRFQPLTMEKPSFLDRYQVLLRIDHTIIMCIFFLVLLTVVYAYGFESGKKSAMIESLSQQTPIQNAKEQILSDKTKKETVIIDTTKISPDAGINHLTTEALGITNQEEILKESEPLVAIAEKEEKAAKAGKELIEKMSGKYTIQLATYKNSKDADQQIQSLSAKGYKGFVIPSGAYHQVCVNAFQDRQSAKGVLKALQSKKLAPSDAYIRAMPV